MAKTLEEGLKALWPPGKPHSWRGRKNDVKCRRCGLVRRYREVDGRWDYTDTDGTTWVSLDTQPCNGDPK